MRDVLADTSVMTGHELEPRTPRREAESAPAACRGGGEGSTPTDRPIRFLSRHSEFPPKGAPLLYRLRHRLMRYASFLPGPVIRLGVRWFPAPLWEVGEGGFWLDASYWKWCRRDERRA